MLSEDLGVLDSVYSNNGTVRVHYNIGRWYLDLRP